MPQISLARNNSHIVVPVSTCTSFIMAYNLFFPAAAVNINSQADDVESNEVQNDDILGTKICFLIPHTETS